MSRLKQDGVVNTSAQSISVSRAVESNKTIDMVIPGTTEITCDDASWEDFTVPTEISNSSVILPTQTDLSYAVARYIQIGVEGTSCGFSKPIKLVLPGDAGKVGFYVDGLGDTHTITNACDALKNPTVAEDEECAIDSGSDLLIYTRHATDFGSFETTEIVEDSGSSSSGGAPIQDTITLSDVFVPAISYVRTISVTPKTDATIAQVAVSLNSNFADVGWMPYTGSVSYTLPDTYGKYTLYVKVRTAQGVQSNVVSRSMIYQEKSDIVPPTVTEPLPDAEIHSLPFVIRGVASPLAKVSIEISGSTYTVDAGEDGAYEVTVLDALESGEYSILSFQVLESGEASDTGIQTITYVDDTVVVVVEDDTSVEETDGIPDTTTDTNTSDDGITTEKNPQGIKPLMPKQLTAPSQEEVAIKVEKVTERSAFLLVLSNKTTQFKRQQLNSIHTTEGGAIDMLIRPSDDVHSITARLYPVEDVTGKTVRRDTFSRGIASFFFPEVYAQEVADMSWVKGYVFNSDEHLTNAYRGVIDFKDVPAGTYRLVVTLNQKDGKQVDIAKKIVTEERGTVYKTGTTIPVAHARVSVWKRNADGIFEEWNGSIFGQENPVFTDEDGRYAIDVPEGTYTLHVEATGYQTYESDPMISDTPTTLRQDISLTSAKRSLWRMFWDWIKGLLGR